MHQYRYQDGPLTTISIIPGAVIVTMEYDLPGSYTKLHSHVFHHWMECVNGAARIVIDDNETIVKAGDRYLVDAGKQHGVWPLASNTMLRCVHNNPNIRPEKLDADGGIPLEWLDRLTHPKKAEHEFG